MQHAFKDLMRTASKGQELSEVLKYYVTHHMEYLPRAVNTKQFISECNTESPTSVTAIQTLHSFLKKNIYHHIGVLLYAAGQLFSKCWEASPLIP